MQPHGDSLYSVQISIQHKRQVQVWFLTDTHLSLHIKREAEEQRKVEAQFQDVIPVLRRQHGLHEHNMHMLVYMSLH